ncbi:glycosyltransferase family 31 protein [Aspergillus saccharolyticus JOP 1030-1]|uniref:Glycosyltransferase family 31 protein n=1 Tax=Aspergillus saccharolyticus JOP 1030-1 TaxID=1450539 RepID=A0A318ZR13_9EURO|nr:hypothetical protein BP01DRAFT_355203 [Aspergillus saccharolyticus JOP 1030-1]PYH46803.1 hypothetical protein BP01DRAFT_355203 [Aspergillus saccharolyticus JOP 1030-1]
MSRFNRHPSLLIAAAVLAACLFFLLSSSHGTTIDEPLSQNELNQPLSSPNDDANSCSVDLELLRQYVTNPLSVDYARLEIAVDQSDNFTGYSDDLNVKFPKFRTVSLDGDAQREDLSPERCTPAATIKGPRPRPRPDASHLIFGVATSMDRLLDSLDAFAHWAGGTNARILAVVDTAGSAKKEAMARAEALGIRLIIREKEAEERLDRWFYLVQDLYRLRDEKTQWVVLIDDDTFFPSMQRLVDRLATYDTTQPLYVGSTTEDLFQLYSGGLMAYGGAGIFLSLPLVQQLQPFFEECYVFKSGGDRMLARCIYAHTNTKLTWERGLFQVDLRGDASGFYEAGREQPLSVHHWKSWFQADMVALSKVASVAGDEALLHRWLLPGDWYLVNGFSVIKYATISDDPMPMEQTWDESKYTGPDPFTFSLGPLRRKDENKISYRLQTAVSERERVRQIYTREVEPGRVEVLEVVWAVASTNSHI